MWRFQNIKLIVNNTFAQFFIFENVFLGSAFLTLCIYVRVCVWVCACVCVRMQMCVCLCVCMCVFIWNICSMTHKHVLTFFQHILPLLLYRVTQKMPPFPQCQLFFLLRQTKTFSNKNNNNELFLYSATFSNELGALYNNITLTPQYIT